VVCYVQLGQLYSSGGEAQRGKLHHFSKRSHKDKALFVLMNLQPVYIFMILRNLLASFDALMKKDSIIVIEHNLT
jgi:excinuclease UvrABC ATPase subunit